MSETVNRVLALIVDGEPGTGDDGVLSAALKEGEPLAADARPAADGEINTRLKLLAGMLDDDVSSDTRRRLRRLQLVAAVALVGAACFAASPLMRSLDATGGGGEAAGRIPRGIPRVRDA